MGVHITRGVEPWRIFSRSTMGRDRPARRTARTGTCTRPTWSSACRKGLPPARDAARDVGVALAFRIREERRVAVGWSATARCSAGTHHEVMNFAGVRQLPLVFICDNNQWAYSTPTHLEYAVEHLADRAAAYGFDGVVVDGTDVLAVYREAKRAIEKARDGGGPTLIENQTLRMEGHAVHDDAFYVPKELFERWAERDPIERYRTWLADERRPDRRGRGRDPDYVKKLLNDSLQRAEESPQPDP